MILNPSIHNWVMSFHLYMSSLSNASFLSVMLSINSFQCWYILYCLLDLFLVIWCF